MSEGGEYLYNFTLPGLEIKMLWQLEKGTWEKLNSSSSITVNNKSTKMVKII